MKIYSLEHEHLRDVRNKLSHGRPEEVSKEDEKKVRGYIEEIEGCIGNLSEED